jgi:high-affinity iron transporter
LREGLEIILVVTMLLAIVAKAARSTAFQAVAAHGQDARATESGGGFSAAVDNDSARALRSARGSRAIWLGVGLAAAASLVTAILLNRVVSSAQGAAREIIEGIVMLAAAGVLFYVSYWLISHVQAQRWMEFLKRQTRHGLDLGGQGTLALTSFLAVYREGAETSLMYQALLGSEGRTQVGLLGVAAGFIVGVVLLALVAVLIRASSVRLPISVFFKLSGVFLFALAVMFAGNGVFELQNAGVLLTTNLAWMGQGLPWAGLYPNLQVVSVQGLLLVGAILAWFVIAFTSLDASSTGSHAMKLAARRG